LDPHIFAFHDPKLTWAIVVTADVVEGADVRITPESAFTKGPYYRWSFAAWAAEWAATFWLEHP